MKTRTLLAITVLVGLGLMACTPESQTISTWLSRLASPPTAAAQSPDETQLGPYTFPPGINPLTGLPVDDPTLLALRPIAVKISNAPPLVRPQAGIGQADLVFEHYVEAGLTRFTAVFLSQLPRRVGSVRSARLIDVEIPEMLESYLVYAGSSGGVRQRIEASDFAARAFYGVETGPPSYYRDPDLPVPHNLFTDLIAVHQLATERGVNTAPAPNYSALAFAADPPAGGVPVNSIDLRYAASGVYYHYDHAEKRYLRWADGQPHFDATLNRQVRASNVVVMYVNHVDDPTIIESGWGENAYYSIQIQLWGRGRAIIFRDGLRYDGTWEREDTSDMFVLRDPSGEVMRLRPGNTFFQLVPLDFDRLLTE